MRRELEGTRGTVVHAVWTRPDGSTFDQYAYTGTRLRVEFSLYTAAAPKTYRLRVADATKSGYTFDSSYSSVLSKKITVGSSGNLPPIAVANADSISGSAPLTVNFDSSASSDPDGVITGYAWNFGDGRGSIGANPVHIYENVGNYTPTLVVTDYMGATASSSISITATEDNAGCTSNCMSADRISLRYKKKSESIKGYVWIVDENVNESGDGVVHAVWTLPDGSTIDQN